MYDSDDIQKHKAKLLEFVRILYNCPITVYLSQNNVNFYIYVYNLAMNCDYYFYFIRLNLYYNII